MPCFSAAATIIINNRAKMAWMRPNGSNLTLLTASDCHPLTNCQPMAVAGFSRTVGQSKYSYVQVILYAPNQLVSAVTGYPLSSYV